MTASLTPRYHPPCALLRRYCQATLGEAQRLFIASHLALCPSCRQKLQSYEAKAGINLEDMPSAAMDAACLENLLHRIDEHGPPSCIDVTIPPQDAPPSFIPEPLQDYLGVRIDEFSWHEDRRGVFIYQRRTTLSLPEDLRLMRLKRDTRITLSGASMLLVLEGEIRTRFDFYVYSPGDVMRSGWLRTFGATAAKETLALLV